VRATILILLAAVLVAGCTESASNGGKLESVPLRVSPDGMRYKVVTIEGRQFIATQVYTQGGYFWTLAGPIDR